MPKKPFADFLHFLYRLYPEHDNRGDGELLLRFVTLNDEAAFAALVGRHGRLVQGVCRRILGDFHSAEDCFQATFIVLARRAGLIRTHKSLATWLYAVAQRVALRARAKAALLRERETEARSMPREQIDEATWQELRLVLDEEIGRLAEKYRAPLVLCHFEGKTRKRIAQELGWAEGTVARRLTRGRELLKQQLTRRGVALSVPALVAALTEKCAGAPVAVVLTTNTTKAALSILSGQTVAAGCLSGQALALAEQVISVVTAKAKLAAVLASVLLISATGYGSYAAGKTNGASVPRLDNSVPVHSATGASARGATARDATARDATARDAVSSDAAVSDVNRNWQNLFRYINMSIPKPNGDGLGESARKLFLTEDSKKAFDMLESKRFSRIETALKKEDEEFIKKHLIKINIEGINSLYADDLSTVWKQIKYITNDRYFGMSPGEQELIRKFVTGTEAQALQAKAKFPAKCWVVEIRGYTYNQGASAFVKETILANLASLYGPSVNLSKELKERLAAVRTRVTFMTLLKCDQVLNPDPARLVHVRMSYLPALFSEPAVDPNDPKRSVKFDPKVPTGELDRDLWRPVGEMAINTFGEVIDIPPRPPLIIPGPTRTEFAIVFLWEEPF